MYSFRGTAADLQVGDTAAIYGHVVTLSKVERVGRTVRVSWADQGMIPGFDRFTLALSDVVTIERRRCPSSVGRPVRPHAVTAALITSITDRAVVTATGTPYSGDGYVVPMPEHRWSVTLSDAGPRWSADTLAEHIAGWVADVARHVTTVATPARYFGATADGDTLHLDVVQVFSSADWDEARRAARARRYAEVWHVGPDELVPTGLVDLDRVHAEHLAAARQRDAVPHRRVADAEVDAFRSAYPDLYR